MNKVVLTIILALAAAISAAAQYPIQSSARQEVTQVIGDAKISISYFRPNAKGRAIWGCTSTDVIPKGGTTYDCLVPNGQVWRTGANNATVFETSGDILVNGQRLPKGKYGLFSIPGAGEWTIVFNKTWDQWGSFRYDAAQDQLRVSAKPGSGEAFETMTIMFANVAGTTADVQIRWDKMVVPFTIDIGDMNARLVETARREMAGSPLQLANYVIGQKVTSKYSEVLALLDSAISSRETMANLWAKARLLAEMGRQNEAIATGEKAVAAGKAATQDTAAVERTLNAWKSKK
ncbi:MAG TPA: DUF2911 domain-containing protein [Pyrinomonadaceae bacterium]|nr:DUF2911 domain-containing protein [Pyrinomonadaceae bacterium]